MAYDRYENRRGRMDYDRGRRDERGFFERAGDEVASWFGDEDAERRRREDERMNRAGSWGQGRDQEDRDRGRSHDEPRSSRPMNWTSSDRDYRSGYAGYDRDYSSRGSSVAGSGAGFIGGYGEGTSRGYGNSGYGSGRPEIERRDYERSQSPWGRDEYRRTSYAGSARDIDSDYDAWCRRQLDQFDRDYDDYHRERQQRFDREFGTWRESRQRKRALLGQVREHMDVVGSDGETVGKVDCVRGDRIVLTKGDSDDNRHHSLNCSMIETIENDQVKLDMPAQEAKSRFRDEEDRGFFGRGEDRDEETNLNRSFAGTYER
jgi:hypothetical protein